MSFATLLCFLAIVTIRDITRVEAQNVPVVLGDFCVAGDNCSNSVANSQCERISAFTLAKRCQCSSAFIQVEALCHEKLYAAADASCLTCEQNGGRCYDSNKDKKFDGCVCPATKTSSDVTDPTKSCDTNYATVTCNKQQMTVCYSRPKNSYSGIHLKNRESESRCAFRDDSNLPGRCLDLSLDKKNLSICGTQTFSAGRRLVTYENTVIIQKETGGRSREDVEFNAFCNFDLMVQTFSGSITLHGKPLHSEGESVQPKLEMRITDNHLRDVSTTGIFIGSLAKIVINMTDAKNTYQAVLPDTCVATNKPSLTTAGVKSLLLIYNGCPSGEQKYIYSGNSFHHSGGDLTSVEAGPFYMFKVDDSEYVYFHCTVKVCRDATQCAMPKCTPAATVTPTAPVPPTTSVPPKAPAGNRRKRSSELGAVALLRDRTTRAVSGKVSFIKSVDSAAIRVFNSEQEFKAFGEKQGEEECSWYACLTTAQLAGIIATVCVVAILAMAVPSAIARRNAADSSSDAQNVFLTRVTKINRSFRNPKLYSHLYK